MVYNQKLENFTENKYLKFWMFWVIGCLVGSWQHVRWKMRFDIYNLIDLVRYM